MIMMDIILNRFGRLFIITKNYYQTNRLYLLETLTAIQFGIENIEKVIILML